MKHLIVFLFLLFSIKSPVQNLNGELSKFAPFIQALQNFSNYIPQEKVYLHFDNTGYYPGDHIWFKCYVTSAQHHGRFTYTPTGAAGRRRDIAEAEYSGKKYQFDLPDALPQGMAMEVDHLSHPDSIEITFRENGDIPAEMLGVAVLSGGKLQHFCFAWMEVDEISFKMNKTRLPSGGSQIALFNGQGEILCDRLVYTGKKELHDATLSRLSPYFYWNPAVTPDEDGKAKISFYNNSQCTNFSISAETVTMQGMIGIYKNEQ